MKFTGFNFRNLIDLKSNNFLFKDLTIYDHTGLHIIHFSGGSDKLSISFSGNRIYENYGDFVWSYNSGEALDLFVKFNEDKYSFYIGDSQVRNGYKSSDYKLEKLILETNKNGISFTPSFSSQVLDISGISTAYFKSGENVDISIVNKSPAKLIVKSSTFRGAEFQPTLLFEANQTGVISGNSIKTFSSKDLSSGSISFGPQIFYLNLETNAGLFEIPLISSRDAESESSSIFYYFGEADGFTYEHSFSGYELANSFKFSPSYLDGYLSVGLSKVISNNEKLNITGFVKMAISGLTGLHTGSFITGIQISNSGNYSEVPSVHFSSFSGFKSISTNEKNLISYEAGDHFDLEFSGSCSGMSATAYTKRQSIDVYSSENPIGKFRSITGVVVNSGGRGLTGAYSVSLPNGVIDYPSLYTDYIAQSLGYSPVKFESTLFTSAGYASGIAILDSGLVTGVIIVNPGSGYDEVNQFPKISFIRAADDVLSSGASGVCFLNQSGEIVSMENNWLVMGSTGFGEKGLFSQDNSAYTEQLKTGILSGDYYFGPIVFGEGMEDYLIKIESKNNSSYESSYLTLSLFESGNEHELERLTLRSANVSYTPSSRMKSFVTQEENFIE